MIHQPQGRILNLQATEVLEWNLNAREEGFKILCNEGGSRSSKTWSIFQMLMLDAVQGKRQTFTIVRDKLSWIRATLLKDFEEMIIKYNLRVTPEINYQRQDQVYKMNGSEFGFFGLDYPQKLHGRKQDVFWMNEVVPEASQKSFDQLEMRTTGYGIIDYNPIDDGHWVFPLQKRPDVKLIKSTWRNNPFVADAIIKKILSYDPSNPENVINGTADPYMWEVYGLGNKARLQGTILNNWDIIEELPKDDQGNIIPNFIGYAQDFGFTNDPTTLIALYMGDNELYWDELLYETGLTNDDIVSRYQTLEIDKRHEIWADSSEPKSIEEIRRHGYNIKGVVKGQDSINFGLDLLKQYKMHITKRSIHIEQELRKYKWAEDKTGRLLNKPVDAFNHTIDPMRYIGVMKLRKQPQMRIISGASLGL